MGVVVKSTRNNGNKYYLHEVLLQKNGDNSAFKTGSEKQSAGTEISPILSLLQKLQIVNTDKQTEFQDRFGSTSDEQLISDFDGYSDDVYGDERTRISELLKTNPEEAVEVVLNSVVKAASRSIKVGAALNMSELNNVIKTVRANNSIYETFK